VRGALFEITNQHDIPCQCAAGEGDLFADYETGKKHQQGKTKRDNPVFTKSAAVKVRYILLRLSTPSRHNRATAAPTFAIMKD
jgi:hypothetical protein